MNELVRRHSLKANHLSAWRTLARQCRLVVPEIAAAEFGAPVALPEPPGTPVTTPIDLIIGPVMLRLDAATPAARIAELVLALQACRGLPVGQGSDLRLKAATSFSSRSMRSSLCRLCTSEAISIALAWPFP